MKEPIEELKSMVVGRAAVRLEGDRKVCRLIECNLGIQRDTCRKRPKKPLYMCVPCFVHEIENKTNKTS